MHTLRHGIGLIIECGWGWDTYSWALFHAIPPTSYWTEIQPITCGLLPSCFALYDIIVLWLGFKKPDMKVGFNSSENCALDLEYSHNY
jgi:hypothetical protein